jgi:hypothetical protein
MPLFLGSGCRNGVVPGLVEFPAYAGGIRSDAFAERLQVEQHVVVQSMRLSLNITLGANRREEQVAIVTEVSDLA